MNEPKDMTMEEVFPLEWVHIKDNEPVFKCLDELCYVLYNHNPDGSVADLPTLPIGLGRSLGKRAYKSERQKAKARVGGIGKMWHQSPLDNVRGTRNSGRNSEG